MKEILLALLLARGGDAATTCVALHRGAHEVNPIMPNHCAAAIGVQAGVGAAQVLLLRADAKAHPTRARIVGLARGDGGANRRTPPIASRRQIVERELAREPRRR